MRVLVVEDEADIAELLQFNLEREGFHVETVKNGEEVLPAVEKETPALILLDLMLPGIGGVEVCRRIRARPETKTVPIIMLTARGSEADIVLGFESGADDYVVKPFSPIELMARIRAVVRRSQGDTSKEGEDQISGSKKGRDHPTIKYLDLEICPDERWVKVEGHEIFLTRSEFDILLSLVDEPGKVFRRDELIQKIAGETIVGDRTVDVHIAAIRRKIGSMGHHIETIRGVGYRFKKA
jgi:DNA-binding response OmpR family regulator